MRILDGVISISYENVQIQRPSETTERLISTSMPMISPTEADSQARLIISCYNTQALTSRYVANQARQAHMEMPWLIHSITKHADT